MLAKHLKFREICLRNAKIASIFLKNAAVKGFNLFEIGSMLYKSDPDELSDVEKIISFAKQLCKSNQS